MVCKYIHSRSKKEFLLALLLISLSFFAAHATETTSQPVNPFNKFSAAQSSDGVNMYTGNAFFKFPLPISADDPAQLTTELSYSSNVYQNARVSNKLSQTPWVGLGWSLGYGSIIAAHKGTKVSFDDEWWWVSPQGVKSRLLQTACELQAEKDPYTRIVPQADGSGVIRGWILTITDGTQLKYGEFIPGDAAIQQRKATRNTFCIGDYVGRLGYGTPTEYPYQWDLCEIEDPTGAKTTFEYQQDNSTVQMGAWSSGITYTRGSYLKTVRNIHGSRLEFVLEDRPTTELCDQYTFHAEPDGYMEIIETKRLKEVWGYTRRFFDGSGNEIIGNPVRKWKFSYGQLHADIGSQFEKPILKEISEYGVKADLTETLFKTTRFNYNGEAGYANDNFGSLARMVDMTGLQVNYDYAQVAAEIQQCTYFENSLGSWDNYTYIKNVSVAPLGNGNSFAVVHKTSELSETIQILQWQDDKWAIALSETFDIEALRFDNVYAGEGYVVAADESNNVYIYTYDGKQWNRTFEKLSGDKYLQVFLGRDFVVLCHVYNNESDYWGYTHAKMITYKKNKTSWRKKDWGQPFGKYQFFAQPGDGYFLLRDWFGKKLKIYTWNGEDWQIKDMGNVFPTERHLSVSAGSDFFAVTGGCDAKLFRFNGNDWVESLSKTFANEVIPFAGTNYAAFGIGDIEYCFYSGYTPSCGVNDNFRDLNSLVTCIWDGQGWIERNHALPPYTNNQLNSFAAISDRYFVLSLGSKAVVYTKNLQGDNFTPYVIDNVPPTVVTWGQYAKPSISGLTDGLVVGGIKTPLRHFYNDGRQWNSAGTPYAFSVPSGYEAKIASFSSWDNCYFINISVKTPSPPDVGVNNVVVGGITWQDKFTGVLSFPVSKKTVTTCVTSDTKHFSFSASKYSTDNETARFSTATTILPKNGKIVEMRYNGRTDVPNGKHYDGLLYEKTYYSESDKVVQTSQTDYSLFRYNDWHPEIFDVRDVEQIVTLDGVAGKTSVTYNNANGRPKYIDTYNSDGTVLRETRDYAFEDDVYSEAMGTQLVCLAGQVDNGTHMLSQVCQTKYSFRPADPGVPWAVVQAEATTWSNNLGATTWVPYKVYQWKSDMGADGRPVLTFVDFDHGTTTNDNWVLKNTVEKYSSNGMPLDVRVPATGPTTTLLSRFGQHPVANFQNASYKACYYESFDEPSPALSSGGSSVLTTTSRKYGPMALSVSTYAHSQWQELETALTGNKSYTYSAWVYATAGAQVLFYASINSPAVEAGNYHSTDLPSSGYGKWTHVEGRFTAKPGTKYLSMRVVNNATGSIYVDEMKFYPSDALPARTIYDADWMAPAVSVDANENPGRFVDFDCFGRAAKWWKVNAAKGVTETGFKSALVQSRDFQISSESFVGVLSPRAGELYYAGTPITIQWEKWNLLSVNIEISNNGGTSWNSIATNQATASNGIGSYTWTPSGGYGACVIRVKDVTGPGLATTGTLTIKLGAIVLADPQGGRHYKVNSKIPISWSCRGIVNNVMIQYSIDNKATWSTIPGAGSLNKDVAFFWNIPANWDKTKDYWLKISDVTNGGTVFCEMNSPFNFVAKRSFIIKYLFNNR
jgi:hypothetical protein